MLMPSKAVSRGTTLASGGALAAVEPQVDAPVMALVIEATDWLEVLDEVEVELLEPEEVEPDLPPPEGAEKL